MGEEEDGELRARDQHPGFEVERDGRSDGPGDAAGAGDRHVLRELLAGGSTHDEGSGRAFDGGEEPSRRGGEDFAAASH